MKIVYLKPKSTFPFLSSDSLFGAITYALSELYPDKLNDYLKRFEDKNNLPFLISSAFPFLKSGDEYCRFYPKPLSKFQSKDVISYKKFKKIKFLEESIFIDLVSGNIDNRQLFDSFVKKEFLINENNKSFLFKKENNDLLNDNFFSTEIAPHNVIDRINYNSMNIFYSSNYRFKENKGLFFLVDFLDDSFEEIFLSALKYLRDRGFGKDISTGNGQFDFEIDDFDVFEEINSSEKGQYFLALSRFIPDSEDINRISKASLSSLLYELGDKQSRDSFGLRKKTRFFKEGSIFPFYSKYCGSLVETSDKSVEYGYSFNIRYNQEEL